MGVGRRQFLNLMSIALAGVVLDPTKVFQVNGDHYVNRKLGILFEKPHGWGYVAHADFGELKEKQIFYNEEFIEDDVWEALESSACIVTKYHQDDPDTKGIFSPTIQIDVHHKSEFDDLEYDSFEEFIELAGQGTATFLRDFTILDQRKVYEQDGNTFYEYYATYTFEHVELEKPLQVDLNLLAIEHNNFYYFLNFHDCPEQYQVAKEEFEQFKKGIRLI